MNPEANQYSLADFYFPDTDDPLKPPSDYFAWRNETAWATSLYEPVLSGADPVCTLELEDGPHQVINLTSYAYLGLVKHPKVVAAAREALELYGVGSCGSPILSGKTALHRNLEKGLSELTGREAVLLFNSGFGGALGSTAGLLRKGDVAIVDERAHLSLLDGAKVGGARIVFFSHNDAASLDEALSANEGKRRLVIIEGIYSMDGDMADLPRLLEVTEARGAGIFIDEAHSMLCSERRWRCRTFWCAVTHRHPVRNIFKSVFLMRRFHGLLARCGRLLTILCEPLRLQLRSTACNSSRPLHGPGSHERREMAARAAVGKCELFQGPGGIDGYPYRQVGQLCCSNRGWRESRFTL